MTVALPHQIAVVATLPRNDKGINKSGTPLSQGGGRRSRPGMWKLDG